MALSVHAVEEIRALPARFPEIRSAVMPALEPFGRVIEQVGSLKPSPFAVIGSPTALSSGFTSSQLYSLLAGLVAL